MFRVHGMLRVHSALCSARDSKSDNGFRHSGVIGSVTPFFLFSLVFLFPLFCYSKTFVLVQQMTHECVTSTFNIAKLIGRGMIVLYSGVYKIAWRGIQISLRESMQMGSFEWDSL